MSKAIIYSAIGCFVGTILALVLAQSNFTFFLLLLPMWGFVIGVTIANVVSKKDKTKPQ